MLKFRLWGMQVTVSFLSFALVTAYLLVDKNGYGYCGILAAIMHELAHIIVYVALGRKPQAVTLAIEGIRLKANERYLSPRKEAFALSAGCFVNLSMFVLLSFFPQSEETTVMAWTHLSLGVFNLLPVGSLDGGMLVRLFLEHFFSDTVTERWCFALSIVIVVILFMLSLWMFYQTGNFTLIITSLFLIFTIR